MDEEDFMREVEADRGMRSQMNLYKSEQIDKKKTEDGDTDMANDDDEEDDQEVKLEELLEGLVVESGPDPEDDVGEEEFFGYEEGEKAAKDGIKYVGREEARQMREKEAAVPKSTFGQEY